MFATMPPRRLGLLALVVLLTGCGSKAVTGGDDHHANAPTLSAITPSTGSAGVILNVTLTGTGFSVGTTVAVSGSGIVVSDVSVAGSTSLTATFAIGSNTVAGPHSVTVTTTDGISNAQTFTTTAAAATTPTLSSVTPSSGSAGTVVNVSLTGTHFVIGATTVTVAGTGITASGVVVTSATALNAVFTLAGAATAGAHSVTVTTVNGTSGPQPFTVVAMQPSPNPWPAPAYRGATGKGVVIAILDRGIQWQHPDFIKPDGNTRIKWMLDMTGQNTCNVGNPAPVEYSEAQINTALHGGVPLPMRDAVGHGTVTAGIAAGNGSAAGNGRFAGVAPEADLIIVKLTSDGAPAHGDQAAEAPFLACYSQALDWLDQKVTTMGEPMAALINSGVMLFGPGDGTSALSQKLDQMFSNRPGRIYIGASGDEGGLPTHAGGDYGAAATVVNLRRNTAGASPLAIWNTGAAPANITIAFDDGTTVGPIGPGGSVTSNGVIVTQYLPGQEFYPSTSTSGDRMTYLNITGHATTGRITIQSTNASSGHFDIYADFPQTTVFTDHLVPGRLTETSGTHSAIIVGAFVNSNTWTDVDGAARSAPGDIVGQLWGGSSGGPTRDGRLGIDIVAGGENVYAAFGTTSYWGSLRGNLIQGGNAFYGRQGATSGASPIVLGTAALMLQLRPTMTNEQARALIHSTAITDGYTGAVPNNDWGFGKLNIKAIIDQLGGAGVRQ